MILVKLGEGAAVTIESETRLVQLEEHKGRIRIGYEASPGVTVKVQAPEYIKATCGEVGFADVQVSEGGLLRVTLNV